MTGISTLGQALDQIDRLKQVQTQFTTLTTQMTTGKISQNFVGLGADGIVSQRARANFNSIDVYMNNITNAERRIDLSSNAIDAFKKQAENFAAGLIAFGQESAHQKGDPVYYDDPLTAQDEHVLLGYTSAETDVDLANLQRLAQSVYDLAVDLVNQKDGDRYLFSGSDSLSKPLNDAGSLDSMVSSLIGSWKGGTLNTSGLISGLQSRDAALDPNAVTDSIMGYSPALSAGAAGKTLVRADTSTEVDYTTLGNDTALRNILVAASYFKSASLGPVADQVDPNTYAVIKQGAPGATIDAKRENFDDVFQAMTLMVNNAIDDLDQLRFNLAEAKGRLGELKENHVQSKEVLQTTITDVENADTTEIAVKLQALQIQLQASYQVTATLMNVNLLNYLNGN